MSTKKTKCDLCDKAPVAWYWYGNRGEPNSLAVCSAHERRVAWAAPFCYRIERLGHDTIDVEQNAYASKTMEELTGRQQAVHHEPRTSNDPVRECLIDAIIESLPIWVSRKLFDKWTLEELKRFSPLSIPRKAPM